MGHGWADLQDLHSKTPAQSAISNPDKGYRPHGMTGTVDTEFWGEPSMILSLIAMYTSVFRFLSNMR